MAGDRFLNGASDEELEGFLAHEIAHVSHMTKPRIMPILATVLIVVQLLFILMPRIFIVLGGYIRNVIVAYNTRKLENRILC